jgi:hypothetical protein
LAIGKVKTPQFLLLDSRKSIAEENAGYDICGPGCNTTTNLLCSSPSADRQIDYAIGCGNWYQKGILPCRKMGLKGSWKTVNLGLPILFCL